MSGSGQEGMFYADIASVLAGQHDGDQINGNNYDALLRTLADPFSEVPVVIQCLQDLEQCVSLVTPEHGTLVKIIMNMDWLSRGPEFAAVYQSLMLNLVSAHMTYFKPCLRMLVKKFTPDPKKNIVSTSAEEDKKKSEQDSVHIHALLRSLSVLVPTTDLILIPVLEELFPYVNKGAQVFEPFCRNSLAICHYMPGLRLKIMGLVVKNMLKLDVRASRADINSVISSAEEEVKEEEEEETMFDMEDMKQEFKPNVDTKEDIKVDSKPSSDDVKTPETSSVALEERLAEQLPVAVSLDAVMLNIFKFLRETCFVNGKLDWTLTKTVYRELLSVFDKYVYLTHASCHVQFIMFYICSFKEALSDGFLDYLWKKVLNPSSQSIHRQIATCYMGSFLTRANFVSTSTAKEVVEILVRWVHQYLEQSSDTHQSADLAHHAAFYSVCQTVFYIFCFRHQDFMHMPKGPKWASSLHFQHIITSRLNPLKVCVPIVVKTFASIARMYQLALCDTIIERNNRYSLPVATSSYCLPNSDQLKLDSYFPFDPYLLPRSQHMIAPLYKQFSGNLADEEDDKEEEVTEDEDDDDFLQEEDDPRVKHEPKTSYGISPMDFLHYSTSPGFQLT